MSIYKPGRPSKYNPTTGVGGKPPAKPGEYRIRDAGGSIAYLGETNMLARRTGEHIRSGIRMDRRTKKKRQQSYGRANRFCHKPEHSARQGHNHGHGKLPVASSVRTHYKNAPHRSVFKRITPQQRFFCITRTNCRTVSRSLSTSASLAGVPFEKQRGFMLWFVRSVL